jgi:hypothetical protein
MLHQIRKMVAVALAVARGDLPAEFIDASLARPCRARTPMGPAGGLLLSGCDFYPYKVDNSKGPAVRLGSSIEIPPLPLLCPLSLDYSLTLFSQPNVPDVVKLSFPPEVLSETAAFYERQARELASIATECAPCRGSSAEEMGVLDWTLAVSVVQRAVDAPKTT